MTYFIPAKTFFLGEYAALAGGPAMLLTTSPCFEVTVISEPDLIAFHPASPAGRLWAEQGLPNKSLHWYDPYAGMGGLGASSAQFLGAYLASTTNSQLSRKDLLDTYFKFAWQGTHLRPSGYDVLAQSSTQCVYVHSHAAHIDSYAWPFIDLAFILVHTGQKLATHEHLQQLAYTTATIAQLITLVESAHAAFQLADSARIIDIVNAYHACLLQMNLVAPHSLQLMEQIRSYSKSLAIKGCGAMGADVLLLLLPAHELENDCLKLRKDNRAILATSKDLYGVIG